MTEAERVDRYLALIWDKVLAGDPRACHLALQLIARKARLLYV